jgi:hypothetical protein
MYEKLSFLKSSACQFFKTRNRFNWQMNTVLIRGGLAIVAMRQLPQGLFLGIRGFFLKNA